MKDKKEIELVPIDVSEVKRVTSRVRDFRYKLSKDDHGKVLKVGKTGFSRVAIEGEFPWWQHGYKDVADIGETGKKAYKDEDGNWWAEK